MSLEAGTCSISTMLPLVLTTVTGIGWWVRFVHHRRFSGVLIKLIIYRVVFALGELQLLVGGGQDVMPEMTILGSGLQKRFHVGRSFLSWFR